MTIDSKTTPPFSHLIPELLQGIFSHLSLQEIASIRLVCELWNQAGIALLPPRGILTKNVLRKYKRFPLCAFPVHLIKMIAKSKLLHHAVAPDPLRNLACYNNLVAYSTVHPLPPSSHNFFTQKADTTLQKVSIHLEDLSSGKQALSILEKAQACFLHLTDQYLIAGGKSDCLVMTGYKEDKKEAPELSLFTLWETMPRLKTALSSADTEHLKYVFNRAEGLIASAPSFCRSLCNKQAVQEVTVFTTGGKVITKINPQKDADSECKDLSECLDISFSGNTLLVAIQIYKIVSTRYKILNSFLMSYSLPKGNLLYSREIKGLITRICSNEEFVAVAYTEDDGVLILQPGSLNVLQNIKFKKIYEGFEEIYRREIQSLPSDHFMRLLPLSRTFTQDMQITNNKLICLFAPISKIMIVNLTTLLTTKEQPCEFLRDCEASDFVCTGNFLFTAHPSEPKIKLWDIELQNLIHTIATVEGVKKLHLHVFKNNATLLADLYSGKLQVWNPLIPQEASHDTYFSRLSKFFGYLQSTLYPKGV